MGYVLGASSHALVCDASSQVLYTYSTTGCTGPATVETLEDPIGCTDQSDGKAFVHLCNTTISINDGDDEDDEDVADDASQAARAQALDHGPIGCISLHSRVNTSESIAIDPFGDDVTSCNASTGPSSCNCLGNLLFICFTPLRLVHPHQCRLQIITTT